MKHDFYIGQKISRLTIADIFPRKRPNGRSDIVCRCVCDCGKQVDVTTSHLKDGHTKSCGCLKHDTKAQLKHGMSHSKIDEIYKGMKARCYNKNSKAFPRYGGRGITICDEWLSDKKKFFEWAFENGYKDGLTIDRIDNDGMYEPSNCRWSTYKVQANNTSKNRRVKWNGESHSLAEWQDILGISQKTIGYRLRRGWTVADALTTPPSFSNCYKGGAQC